MLLPVLAAVAIAGTITYLVTPLVIRIAHRYGLVDDPRQRAHPAHTHTGTIPRAGGLALFIGVFSPALLFISLSSQFMGIFAGALILVLVGIWDDKQDRSPYIRMFTNILAAACVIVSGIGIPYITNPFGGVIPLDTFRFTIDIFGTHTIWVLADLFALIWIVWTMNIVGWSGGVDGQLPGFVAISAVVIGVLSLRYSVSDPNQLHVTFLSFITAGAFLGFLPWNVFPQKIMPGYGGKTLAGFLLAVLSIMAYGKLGTALLVLAVPMTDAAFILIKRMASGRSPVWASSGHLHHHLLAMGWSKRRIALFYWSISAAAGLAALTLNSSQKVFALLLLLVLVGGFILGVNFIRTFEKRMRSEEF